MVGLDDLLCILPAKSVIEQITNAPTVSSRQNSNMLSNTGLNTDTSVFNRIIVIIDETVTDLKGAVDIFRDKQDPMLPKPTQDPYIR